MRLFILILISLNLKALTVVGQNGKNIVGSWMYCDGYTFKYLILNLDNTFLWHYQSCKGDDNLVGSFVLSRDTIYLRGENKATKFLMRGEQIFSYAGEKEEYPDFQPLKHTQKKSKKKAYKECCKIRKRMNFID